MKFTNKGRIYYTTEEEVEDILQKLKIIFNEKTKNKVLRKLIKIAGEKYL